MQITWTTQKLIQLLPTCVNLPEAKEGSESVLHQCSCITLQTNSEPTKTLEDMYQWIAKVYEATKRQLELRTLKNAPTKSCGIGVCWTQRNADQQKRKADDTTTSKMQKLAPFPQKTCTKPPASD
jgi:hypothetical protein